MFHHRSLLGGPFYVLEGPGSVVALLSSRLSHFNEMYRSSTRSVRMDAQCLPGLCVISVLFNLLCTCDVQRFRGLHKLGKPGEATCQAFVTPRMYSRSGVEICGPLKWREVRGGVCGRGEMGEGEMGEGGERKGGWWRGGEAAASGPKGFSGFTNSTYVFFFF